MLLARELPQARVAAAPRVARLVRHAREQPPGAGVEDVAVVDVEPDHVEHVAEHRQLQRADRVVADGDGPDPAPPRDVGELRRRGQLPVEPVAGLRAPLIAVSSQLTAAWVSSRIPNRTSALSVNAASRIQAKAVVPVRQPACP